VNGNVKFPKYKFYPKMLLIFFNSNNKIIKKIRTL